MTDPGAAYAALVPTMRPFDLLPQLLGGVVVTLQVTGLSAGLALIMSFAAGLSRLAPWRPIRLVTGFYVELFRGTSAIVQVFYFFFVLPLLGLELTPLTAGVLALGLNFGAYGSEVVRAAVLNVDRGQREAGVALNMTSRQIMRRILLPQALVAMLPSFGNLLIDLLKATSLVSLITLSDLTFAGKAVVQAQGRAPEVYVLVLFIYFAIAVALGWFVRVLERRASQGLGLGRAA